MELDVLDPQEAADLLGCILGAERALAEPAAVSDLARVCARLPLALRIAAANLSFHPRRTIADQVAELSVDDRLGRLEVEGDEQSAVRVAFDQSYASLEPAARRLFGLLGLVPGADVTAEAAGALAGMSTRQTGRLLDRLANAHLIDQHAPGRYAFHDLLRAYAGEHAAETSTVETESATGRVFDWYLAGTAAAAKLLYPEKARLPLPAASVEGRGFKDAAQALEWLDAEEPNLLAATRHCADHGPHAVAWLLADILRGYFWLRMYTFDWTVLATAGLAAAGAGGDLSGQAAAHLSLADLVRIQGHYHRAIEHYTRAADLAGQAGWVSGESAALSSLGTAYFWLGRMSDAAEQYDRALVIARRIGRLPGQANMLGNLGIVYWLLGELERSADHNAQALALHRQLGVRHHEAVNLANLAESYHALGRLDEAADHLTQALALHREVGDRGAEAESLGALAAVYTDAGRSAEALELARSAVDLARETGHKPIEATRLNTLAAAHQRLGRHKQAVEFHQTALALARETETRYAELTALVGLASAHQVLGHPDAADDYALRALEPARQGGFRVVEGLALTVLAGVRLQLDDVDRAVGYARDALRLHRDTGHRPGEARTLLVLGDALHRGSDPDAAIACWQEARTQFADMGLPEADDVRTRLADVTADRRPG